MTDDTGTTPRNVKTVHHVTIILDNRKFKIEMLKSHEYNYALSLNGLIVASDISDRWDAKFGFDALVQAIALGSDI
jgi:hypothetical protein